MKEESLNIIVGTITSVDKVENSDKLYVVKIDTGVKIVQIATNLASFLVEKNL